MTNLLHIITISQKAASGNGDIAGTKIACSCGFVATTSLNCDVQFIAHDHLVWANKPKVTSHKRRRTAQPLDAAEQIIVAARESFNSHPAYEKPEGLAILTRVQFHINSQR